MLIGFMGAGKTTVGQCLAEKTGLPLFDTDGIVLSKFQIPITKIFERVGEAGFRQEETLALRSVPRVPAIVVTGGGIILQEQNGAAMQQLGTIVWLRATLHTICRRLSRAEDRPLLAGANLKGRITELLAVREPLYLALSDVTVDVDGLPPMAVAEKILEEISR